ncbi:hypothetical protein O6H91_05G070400 [Diphasiastrum complanatum]|uniref:Uncharacterized protein n=1 Tax=Diphasiastrum complanatum TaxID=34168 RepID=A0ACC2DP91_DIPCM|nr:hypothetical protein O6H91_05G070400 [Diphasiastrum complanatum]
MLDVVKLPWRLGCERGEIAAYSSSIGRSRLSAFSARATNSPSMKCLQPLLHLNYNKANGLQLGWAWKLVRVINTRRLLSPVFQSANVRVRAQHTGVFASCEPTVLAQFGGGILNEEQLKAVQIKERCVRVVAGPGSGKTLVLTHRIAHEIVHNGLQPSQILCITFTNKAAKELRERLGGLVGHATSQNMTVGTFHSTCAKLLREFVSRTKVGINSDFLIYDEDDCRRLLRKSLLEVMCSSDQTSYNDFSMLKDQIKRFVSLRNDIENIQMESMNSRQQKRSKQEVLNHQDVKELLRKIRTTRTHEMKSFIAKRIGKYNHKFLDFDTSEIGKVAKAFEGALRRNNAADFDDLIYLVVRMLHECPDIVEICERRWTCVLVDEFQDTDGIQYELIRLLCKKNKNLYVVGDVDQAIYGWRGSEFQHMQNSLQNDFPSIKTLQLQKNYRSSNHILRVASKIIENSAYDRRIGSREGLKLQGTKHSNIPVQVCSLSDPDTEAEFVVNEIRKLQHTSSLEIDDFSILYRTHYQAFALEKAFVRAGIPYKIHGSTPFYSHKEIKVLIAYLQLIVNVQDQMAFERVINTPPRGIGEKTISSLRAWAQKKNISLPEALQKLSDANCDSKSEITSRARKALQSVRELLNTLFRISLERPLGMLIDEIIERTNFLDYIKSDGDADAVKKKLDRIEQLKLLAKYFEMSNESGHKPIIMFLEDVALVAGTDQRQQKEERGAVKLMTLHAAKGLEFKCVFIVGLNDKLFPFQNCDPEEERRLFYVGITRAKDYLYLTYHRFYHGLQNKGDCKVSPFLQEISAKTEFMNIY